MQYFQRFAPEGASVASQKRCVAETRGSRESARVKAAFAALERDHRTVMTLPRPRGREKASMHLVSRRGPEGVIALAGSS